MTDKHLQRVTVCVSYIGQASRRRTLLARRTINHPDRYCPSDEHRPATWPPLEKLGDLISGAQFEPCGPVSHHDRLKHCSSVPDLIGRHLLVEYWQAWSPSVCATAC